MIKSKYQWLGTLYPAMFVEDYKVICMSVKRFFTTIDPIYVWGIISFLNQILLIIVFCL